MSIKTELGLEHIQLYAVFEVCFCLVQQISSTREQVTDYSAVKSRIDCSDPNPSAHKLKHSLNELIVPLGRDINPRFTGSASGKAARIVKSSSFHVEKPRSVSESKSASTLVKSSTFEALFEVGSQKSPEGVPDLESEIEKATQASTNQTESASTASTLDPLEDSSSTTDTMEVGLETVHHHHKLGWTEEYTASSGDHEVIFTSETYRSTAAELPRGRKHRANAVWPRGESESDLPHRSSFRGSSGVTATTIHEEDSSTVDMAATARLSDAGPLDDIQVVDFEVTNSETETTVILKHLLATSSLSKENVADEDTDQSTQGSIGTKSKHGHRSTGSSSLWTMPSIEESDSEESESYYESEEIVATPPLPIVPYTLPIPTVNLQDEDGTILETIIKGREGLKSAEEAEGEKDGTDATVGQSSGSDSLLVINYSPQTVYDDFGPSTKL